MPDIFFISDLHLGHKTIMNWSSARAHYTSIEEHDQSLVKRWNAVVTKRDVVWVLGDVVFPQTSAKYLGEMNGNKHVVLGNHDARKRRVLSPYFKRIEGCTGFKDNTVLTHVPIHPSQLEYRWVCNIHGHLHENSLPDPRYYNVSADVIGLKPIPYEEIRDDLIEKGILNG